MNPDEKEKSTSKDFGKVIDALHNKAKLSSLRTYQGDMAEFIKSKDESVISVAIKEKERKEAKEQEKRQEANLELPKTQSATGGRGLQINLTIIVSSLLLLAGGLFGFFYVFDALDKPPTSPTVIEEKIIPYNHSLTLANVTEGNFESELAKLSPASGISILNVSDTNGALLQTSADFLNFLQVSPPATLTRTLDDEYVIGITSQNGESAYFVVLTVGDFGKAFSAMLDWERTLVKDLSFLGVEIGSTAATSTSASTTVPVKEQSFSWRDIIIKNKDTRAFATDKNKAKMVYTFLDKNTILITSSFSAIGDISAAYAARSVVR